MSIIITPKGAPASTSAPQRPTVTMNTTGKSPISAKFDAIKQRFSGAPQNKQGETIPPVPSGAVDSKANPAPSSTSEAKAPAPEATTEAQSPQLQALARQQQQLRKAQQELKAQQDAWKQEQAKYISKDVLASDTLKALAEAGISQDRLVELQLNQSAPPSETQLLNDKIAELERKLNGVDETFKSRDKQAYDNAVLAIERDVKLLVNSDPAYETIKALGDEGHKEVVELIKKQFALDGTVLDVEDAAKQIEELALEREYNRLQKLSQLSKIKQKLAPPAPAVDESTQETAKQDKSSQTNTLTNNMGKTRPLSARERAIRAFEEAAKRK